MITVIRTEAAMDGDATAEKLNASEGGAGKNGGEEESKRFIEKCGGPGEKFLEGNAENSSFDWLMDKIGNDGKFQKRFDWMYNFVLVSFVSMPFLNIILAMTIPDHWCHVPGRELTNLSVEEWKAMHIPLDRKNEKNAYSSCKMYKTIDTHNKTVIDCQYGWDYDRQWYTETAPSAQNWVCDREVYVSNIFAAGRVGEIIGTFIFGQLGDQFGRKPVFYISLFILVFGRILSAFTSELYYVFLITIGIGSTASISVFQSPLVISMEVSDSSKRSFVAFLQCVGWVLGLCALSLLAWIIRDWQLIIVISTLPSLVYFFLYRFLPESPRWLASKGETKKASKVLKYISRINGTVLPEETEQILRNISDKKENFYGIPTLFLHWRLAKNTIIIIFCWGISGLCYYILVLNVTTMLGNPFLNFFFQSLVELPGYIFGKIFSNLIGRRWTQTGAYALSCIFCSFVILVRPLQNPLLEIFFVSLVKLCFSTSFFMVWLQAIEIYPTCVRQTGTSLGGLISNAIGIVGPYVVFLGTSVHANIPYIIILCAAVLSGICSSFLPETHDQKLPETLEDAQNFGKDQKFWTFTIYRKK